MIAHALPLERVASRAARFSVGACEHDVRGVAVPRVEAQIVLRFGPSARRGLDGHAFGAREHVHRKVLPAGTRTISARLRLGVCETVLGVPASALAGRIVALEDLWGATTTERLMDRLAAARDASDATAILELAIAARLPVEHAPNARARLALAAAEKLTHENVRDVAVDLGISERHLRRLFHESVGVSPKTFAKLARFHRALHAARANDRASWGGIAVAAGYYDQAHLIADFRAIAGATPRAFLDELRAPTRWIG